MIHSICFLLPARRRAAVAAASSTGPHGVNVTVTENDAVPDTITEKDPRTLSAGSKIFGRLNLTM